MCVYSLNAILNFTFQNFYYPGRNTHVRFPTKRIGTLISQDIRHVMSNETDTRRLVLSIIDFFQNELTDRNDLTLEDRDSLRIAIECLELAYGLENQGYVQRRSLFDIYSQAANPVSIKDKLQAESFKNDGNAKMTQEQFQQAEEDYTRAIELDKWNAIYFCNRAAARLKLGQFYDAISDCRQALVLNPDYAKAYGRMGQVYVQMNRPRSAASCFQHAVRLEPDNQKYQNNLQVAHSQTAPTSAMGMDHIIQNILSMIAGGESEGQEEGVPPGLRPFMILSEPHRAQDCNASHTTNQNDGSNPNPSANQQESEGNQGNTDDISDNETLHFRMLVGIPRYTIVPEGDSHENPKNDAISSPLSESANKPNESEPISGEKPDLVQPKAAGNNPEKTKADSTVLEDLKNVQESAIKSPGWVKKDELKTTEDNVQAKDPDPFKQIVESITKGMSRYAATQTDDSYKTPGKGAPETKPTNGENPIQEQPKTGKNNAEKSAVDSITLANNTKKLTENDKNSPFGSKSAFETDQTKLSSEEQPKADGNNPEKSETLENSRNVQENKVKPPERMKKEDSKTNGDNTRTRDSDPFKEIVESMTAGMQRNGAVSKDDCNNTSRTDKNPSLFLEEKPKTGEETIQGQPKTDRNSTEKFQENGATFGNSKNMHENQGKSTKQGDESKDSDDTTQSKDSLKETAKSMTASLKNLLKQNHVSDLLKQDGKYTGVKREDVAVVGTSKDERESLDKDIPGNKSVAKRLEKKKKSSSDDKNSNPTKEKEEIQGYDSQQNRLQNRISSFFKKSLKSKSDKSKKSKEPDENQTSSTKIEDSRDENFLKESKDDSSD